MTEQATEGEPSEGWSETSLKSILSVFETGTRPRGGVRGISSGVPSLGGEHIDDQGGFDLSNTRYVPHGFYEGMTRGHIDQGDILIVKDGATTGKVAIVREDFPFRVAVINEHVFRCRIVDGIESSFVFWFLWSQEGQRRVLEHFQGSAQGGINQGFASGTLVPIAPLAEQRRIVAKAEALLARVQATRKRLARVPLILKRFRQAVLTAACNGQLTSSWAAKANPESFQSMVQRISSEHRATIPNEDAEAEPNEGWVRVTLGFLALPTLRNRPFVTSGSRGWARLVSSHGPYFIRSENINTDCLRLEDAIRVTPPAGPEATRSRVQPGDMLLTITGNNVGRTAIVPSDCPPAHVSQHVAIVRIHPAVCREFIWLWMRSQGHGQKQLEAFYYGETKPGLNLEQVKSVWVDLPPLAEQQEIVRRVEALFKLADAIERRVAAATARADKLSQAILAKAFRGELVPTEAELARAEGRDYETAEQLLQRIQQAAKSETKTPKPKRSGRRNGAQPPQ